MAVSLKHLKNSAVADGGDTNLVQPSDWNAEHTLTLATDKLLGRATAGTGAVEEITCTSFARTLLDDANASTARTTLGAAVSTSVTVYTPTVGAGSGSLGSNPPTATGSYFDVGNIRWVTIAVTFPSNYVAGGGTAGTWITATLPSTLVTNTSSVSGNESAVVGTLLAVTNIATLNYTIIRTSSLTYIGTDNYVLSVFFPYAIT